MPPKSLSLASPLPPSPPTRTTLPFKTTPLPTFFLPRLPLQKPRPALSSSFSSSSSRKPMRAQEEGGEDGIEEEILRSVANASESRAPSLPCVRTFENDLALLSLVGSVAFDQALTAAAADGGRSASHHLRSGLPSMVVETVFPGPSDPHATVSTRLFLPAEKVKDRAKKLKQRIPEDVLLGTSSENILATTFRQVVLRKLWNFELRVLPPGSVRDMAQLDTPREVPASFLLRSSDERMISMLAEAVCAASLRDTERRFFKDVLRRHAGGFFSWFRKRETMVSSDSSVVIDVLLENEVLENARSLLGGFNSSSKDGFEVRRIERRYNWWQPVGISNLDKIGGQRFSAWVSEYVPVYRLEIDADNVKDISFEGWVNSAENKWEVVLTHSQMVGLAEVLDMYIEDVYSLPGKELPSTVIPSVVDLPSKKSNTLINILTATVAGGIFLVAMSMLSLFYFPHLRKGKIYTQINRLLPTKFEYVINERLSAAQRSCSVWIGDIAKKFESRDRGDFGTGKTPEASSAAKEEIWDKTSVPET